MPTPHRFDDNGAERENVRELRKFAERVGTREQADAAVAWLRANRDNLPRLRTHRSGAQQAEDFACRPSLRFSETHQSMRGDVLSRWMRVEFDDYSESSFP